MLYQGDCLVELPRLDELIVDTVITDPPYELGFMGKRWDSSGVAFQPETWESVLRVCKPGAFLLAFGGTRTFHRLTCAIEDAGWEIRDCIMWLYGSGFPKSLDISKAIDKAAGAERKVVGKRTNGNRGGGANTFDDDAFVWPNEFEVTQPATDAAREWSGWGSALKPAFEPIIVAMKPLDGTFAQNAQRHGVAGLNIDGGRINGEPWKAHDATGLARDKFFTKGPCAIVHKEPHNLGRWPANVILDGDAGKMLDEQSGHLKSGVPGVRRMAHETNAMAGRLNLTGQTETGYGDSGGASRFFYCPKASRSERGDGNNHPTVKPLKLMEYLCRLTATPTGGTVLDPFMGSGTTGVACVNTGRNFIGIERDPGYFKIAEQRIEAAQRASAELLFPA